MRITVKTESLGDFVRRIRTEKKLSCADVSNRSVRKGERRISGSYINRIENYPNLSEKDSEEFRLLTRFRKLSRQRKVDLLKIIDALYSQEVA